ncbi:MAG TPA: hypothetical protein VJQ84_05585 [Solirubrobacterales bacterium]|nr:hypothetical protein [Solirubrobacterales bacterium]
MKLRGALVIAALISAAFFAGYAGTSSATVLCKIKLPECVGNDLPVPETVTATMTSTSAVFTQALGTSCKASSLEWETTEDLGFWPEPLLAEIIGWKFSSCTGSCSTVTTLTPREAEFQAVREGSPPTNWNGNGSLKIFSPEIKLSGCSGGGACTDNASSIVLEVKGGAPMKLIAHSVPMSVTGASCGTSATFSGEYLVLTKFEKLFLEPVP